MAVFRRKPPPHLSEAELASHPSWRRYTRKYQRKKRIVRDLWLGSSVLMLMMPTNMVLVMALGTTFASFMILDETP